MRPCGRSSPIFRTTVSLRRAPPFAVLASCEAIGATGRDAKAPIPQRPGPLHHGTLGSPALPQTPSASDSRGSNADALHYNAVAKSRRQTLGTETGLGDLQKMVQTGALPGVKLPAPLLPSHVLRVAEQRSCSIMDAVLTIRDDPAGQSFRNYLWDNRRTFDPVFAQDHLRAKALQQESNDIGKRIARAKSATGVFNDMAHITLNLPNVPYLHHLLNIIGKRKINVPIALPRRPPTYEVFIARWFR
jgi:hypothetical protein